MLYAHIDIHTHIYIHTYIHIYIYIHIHIHVCIFFLNALDKQTTTNFKIALINKALLLLHPNTQETINTIKQGSNELTD